MADIARALGISTNSVSLALTNRPGVSEETRQRVMHAAEALGHTPQARQRRDHLTSVALVFNQDVLHPPATVFFGPLIEQLQRTLARQRYSLTLFGINESDEEALRLPPLRGRDIQGIIVLSAVKATFVRALQSLGRVFWVDHYEPSVQYDKIVIENVAGAYAGTEHLILGGYDSIGFLGDLSHSPSYVERWQGYRLALERYHLPHREEWEWTTAYHDPEHLQSFWDSITDHPSAWFCVNDLLAVGLLEFAHGRDLSCPADFGIVGFDDLQQARLVNPGITTLHVDRAYYAQRVVDVLLARLANPQRPVEIVRVVPPVVVRGSSAPRESLVAPSPENRLRHPS